jgi:hypothetical protein
VKAGPPQIAQIAQIAMTVNGLACPRELSSSPQFPFVQRVFELANGPAKELPGTQQAEDIAGIFRAAHEWLDEVEDKLATQIAAVTDG